MRSCVSWECGRAPIDMSPDSAWLGAAFPSELPMADKTVFWYENMRLRSNRGRWIWPSNDQLNRACWPASRAPGSSYPLAMNHGCGAPATQWSSCLAS